MWPKPWSRWQQLKERVESLSLLEIPQARHMRGTGISIQTIELVHLLLISAGAQFLRMSFKFDVALGELAISGVLREE